MKPRLGLHAAWLNLAIYNIFMLKTIMKIVIFQAFQLSCLSEIGVIVKFSSGFFPLQYFQ